MKNSSESFRRLDEAISLARKTEDGTASADEVEQLRVRCRTVTTSLLVNSDSDPPEMRTLTGQCAKLDDHKIRLRESRRRKDGRHGGFGDEPSIDLDAIAGNVAYSHCVKGGSWPTPLLVTAGVDSIQLCPDGTRADVERDMLLTGAVQWVGSSSLSLTMSCRSEGR